MATNKVRDDAVHFVVGFEHEHGRKMVDLEIYAMGPCRSFAVQSETESRVSGKQSRYVSAGSNRRDRKGRLTLSCSASVEDPEHYDHEQKYEQEVESLN